MLEELASFGRYKNYRWVNELGEQNGPLDFILLNINLGVQLKTTVSPRLPGQTGWSSFRSFVRGGLDQLVSAINSGTVTSGRLDIMIPPNQAAIIDDLQQAIEDLILPSNPNYAGLTVVVGTFIE